MTLDLVYALVLAVALGGCALLGRAVRTLLPEPHRSRETMDFVRAASSLLVTFTALVLGLLITTVNTDFNRTDTDLHGYAATIILLDGDLQDIGAPAREARALLRQYTAAAIASTWTEEPAPSGRYPTAKAHGTDIDAYVLGDLLRAAQTAVRTLTPGDAVTAKARESALARVAALLHERWALIGEAHSTVTPPFFVMMVLWLAIVFLSFGMTAPDNPIAIATIALIAISVAGAVFILLELDGPLDGLVKVGSEPLRHALIHLDRTPPAP